MRLLTYLACPYTHTDPEIRDGRFRLATAATKLLIKWKGWNVFSPITHSHPLHLLGLDGDWKFWAKTDTEYLKCSRRVVVLDIPGWRESVGVQAEIKIARRMKLPVFLFSPELSSGVGIIKLKKL